VVVFLAFVPACFSSRAPQIEAERSAEMQQIGVNAHADIDRVYESVVQKSIVPLCSNAPDAPLSPPSQHSVRVTDHFVMAPCGTIATEVLTEDAIKQFIDAICGGTDGPDCATKLREMFLARLRERYGMTDWSEVSNKCTAYPMKCQTWINIELWALASHNDAVGKWGEQQYAQANERHRRRLQETSDRYQTELDQAYAEELEHRRRVGAALQVFANAMAQPPTVHCTSNTIGTMTTTNCQ
jgi:hypothetical protein